jgi:hypothetical protein
VHGLGLIGSNERQLASWARIALLAFLPRHTRNAGLSLWPDGTGLSALALWSSWPRRNLVNFVMRGAAGAGEVDGRPTILISKISQKVQTQEMPMNVELS